MSVLYRADGSSADFNTPEEVRAALATGQWHVGESGTVDYTSPAGANVAMTPEMQANQPRSNDYTGGSLIGQASDSLAAALQHAYSGPADQAKGFGEGVADIGSLGISDWLLKKAGADTSERAGTGGRKLGEAAGIVGSLFTGAGEEALAGKALAATPIGLAAKLGRSGESVLGRVAAHAGEGAAYGLGQEVSDAALTDKPFTAETLIQGLPGVFLGAALGAGVGAASEGYSAVKAAAATRRAALGPSKEVADGLSSALADLHNNLDSAVSTAQTAGEAAQKSGLDALRVAHAQEGIGDATILHQAARSTSTVDPALRDALVSARQNVSMAAETGDLTTQDVDAWVKAHNRVAGDVGVARFNKREVAAEMNKFAAGDPGPLKARLAESDAALAKGSLVDNAMERKYTKAAATGSDEHVAAYAKHVSAAAESAGATDVQALAKHALGRIDERNAAWAEHAAVGPGVDQATARTALGHIDGKLTPDVFKRMLRADPATQIQQATAMGKYYEDALAAAHGSEVAKYNATDAWKQFQAKVGSVISPELQSAMEPKVLSAVLNVPEAALPAADVLAGPTGDILRMVGAHNVTTGLLGGRVTKSWLRRTLFAVGRRSGATGMAMLSHSIPGVGALPGVLQAGIAGGAWNLGQNIPGAIAGKLGGGIKDAVHWTTVAKTAIEDAVDHIAAGTKPSKLRAMPLTNGILDMLLGGDTAHTAKKPAEKFKVIQGRLSQFMTSPQSFSHKFYGMLRPVQQTSEHLADSMESTITGHLTALAQAMPTDPGTMMMLGQSMWKPTDRQLYEFTMTAMGTLHPLETIHGIASGLVPPQAVQALRESNPETFAMFQKAVINRVDDIRANSTYDQRIALGLAFGVPLDPTTDPRYVAFMQSTHAAETMKQAAGGAAESKTPQEAETDAQKMLS